MSLSKSQLGLPKSNEPEPSVCITEKLNVTTFWIICCQEHDLYPDPDPDPDHRFLISDPKSRIRSMWLDCCGLSVPKKTSESALKPMRLPVLWIRKFLGLPYSDPQLLVRIRILQSTSQKNKEKPRFLQFCYFLVTYTYIFEGFISESKNAAPVLWIRILWIRILLIRKLLGLPDPDP